MFDEEKLKKVIASILKVPVNTLGDESSMDNIESWDSLKHIHLVLALEDEFDTEIPDEDAAEMTSYKLIRLVLEELGS